MTTWTVGADGYATIQEAIDAAVAGDIIEIADGTYTLTGTLNVNKDVTLIGASEAGVTIDASGLDGYGIHLTADGATLSTFTLLGPEAGSPSGNYGIKADPNSGSPADRLTDITIEKVTVSGSPRSEIDLNGVDGALLQDITANGGGTAGVGIALTDSANITLENISTSGNAWGSVAIYPANRFFDQAADGITFQGTYSATETIKIFVEDASNGISGDGNDEVNGTSTGLADLTLPAAFANNHGYQIKFGDGTDTPTTFYFGAEADADAFLATLNPGQKASAVYETPTGDLLVKAGMSIQVAINAADADDTILLSPDTYAENLTISKAITILGAQHGVDGALRAGPESVIEGTSTIALASGAVVIDGVQINNTSGNTTQFKGIVVTSGADVTIENSRFWSTGPNGNNADRGIELQSGATGTILIGDNFFGGVRDAATDKYSTANWTSGVWSDGNAASLTITGNTFDHVRTGLNLDGYDDSTTSVSGNAFADSGSGISIGTPSAGTVTGITTNTFENVDTDFNLQNVTTGQTFDLDATGNVSTSPLDAMVVLGGTDDDIITGTAGADILLGNGAADVLNGMAGDDLLSGGAGDDTLHGGQDTDTAVYADGLANYTSTPSTDANGFVTGFTQVTETTVVGLDEGSDTLTGVERLVFQNGTPGVSGDDIALDLAQAVQLRLADNVEHLILQGSANLQGYGNSLSNILVGNSGNNILNGDVGVDAMFGGAGNDAYFVDNGGDVVIENADEGTDVVFSTAHLRLSENVETLVLQGSGNLQGYGNSGANTLHGNTGNNLLNGGAGADTMLGGLGNDVYFVDDAGDLVFEGVGAGTDAVFATVSQTLSANVDTLVLQGSANLTGTGNGLDNKLFGNAGENTLDGGVGADRLTGNGGDDTFVFTAGQADGDTVVDFVAGDTLQFFGFGAGTFTQISTDQWEITSAIDAHVETITFANNAVPTDFLFS